MSASKRTEELLRRLGSRYTEPKPSLTFGKEAIALFDFEGDLAGDLTFKKGDVLTVLESTAATNSWTWWNARLNGKSGLVPANYLRVDIDDYTFRAKDLTAQAPNWADSAEVEVPISGQNANMQADAATRLVFFDSNAETNPASDGQTEETAAVHKGTEQFLAPQRETEQTSASRAYERWKARFDGWSRGGKSSANPQQSA